MKKILVIDDDVAVQALLGRFLKAANYEVMFADDGLQGLEMVKTKLPDLIVVDVSMPVMDGITLCAMVKKNEATAHIPVLILTGDGTIGNVENALKEGPDGFLTKPLDVPRFLKKVENLIK